ncbi:hypothetical protein MVEG_06298 [Podila verticillata NRRL 6337]|nr:hypothetical protein MVEG_06298 [Podila verticillata NRRL 6337]
MFDPILRAWAEPTTTRSRPSARFGHCGVSMHNGTKLAVFGGFGNSIGTTLLDDIYILDTTTMVWTRGTPAGGPYSRSDMSCGASVYFLRRQVAVSIVTYNATMIYNIRSDTWVSRFDPASRYSPYG